MSDVTVYGTSTCNWCCAARLLLKKKGVDFDDKLVGNDAALRAEMEQRSGRRSVPQIFVGERHIGGYDDLQRLDKSGELDNILAAD
jgi:glutaredoxin 3